VKLLQDKTMEQNRPTAESDIRVHLVHGTWPYGGWLAQYVRLFRSKAAPWYQPGSSFGEVLLHHLPNAASCSCFEWSGRNGIGARFRAADEFKRYWKQENSSYPTAKHYVIAHSHGGNVVLQALLSEQSIAQTMEGFVTLGTPFLWFEQSESSIVLKAMSWAAQYMALVFILALAACALFIPVSDEIIQFSAVLWAAYGVFLLILVMYLSRRWLHLLVRIHRLAQQVRAVPPGSTIPRMLIVRSPGDEASLALRASMMSRAILLVAWRMFGGLFRFRGPMSRLVVHLGALLIIAFVIGTWAASLTQAFDIRAIPSSTVGDPHTWLDRIGAGLKSIYFFGFTLGIYTALCSSLPLAVAFGPEVLAISLLLTPVVEDAPSNVQLTLENISTTAASRHSVYLNPAALQAITRWILLPDEPGGLAESARSGL
jgi:hypothetical protein